MVALTSATGGAADGVQPALHEARAVGEELVVREDAAGAGGQGAPARQLVVVLGHGDDRQARRVQAPDGGHGVEAAPGQVHDGAAQGGLVGQLVRLEGDGQLRVAAERHRRATGPPDGLGDARGPHEVVREDDHAAAQEIVQVSLLKSSSRRSPSPFWARATSIWSATSW